MRLRETTERWYIRAFIGYGEDNGGLRKAGALGEMEIKPISTIPGARLL